MLISPVRPVSLLTMSAALALIPVGPFDKRCTAGLGELHTNSQFLENNIMQRSGLFLALLLLLFPIGKAEARKQEPVNTYERVTDWVPLEKSMSELLNEGWRIIGFNDYETEMFSDNHSAYSFILSSGNKYVICYLVNPAMNDAKSKCRALN